MESKEIIPGKEYALREGRAKTGDFQRVKAIERVRGRKWRVEWIEPNPGLVDHVSAMAIICPWSEHKKVAKDERREAILKKIVKEEWPGESHPLDDAVDQVFEAASDRVGAYRGILSGHPDDLERIAARAHFELPDNLYAYTDRFGERHYPWSVALELAKALAAAEPQTVLFHIEAIDREWMAEARQPGGSYLLPLLERYRDSWAIIRQWTGFDAERSQLYEEIERLRQLIDKTIWKLRLKLNEENYGSWTPRIIQAGH